MTGLSNSKPPRLESPIISDAAKAKTYALPARRQFLAPPSDGYVSPAGTGFKRGTNGEGSPEERSLRSNGQVLL